MNTLTISVNNENETRRLGVQLAAVVERGTVIALNGPLGAGKTLLVQSVAIALGVPGESVTSPTFVLVNEYAGKDMPVFHFDAYRITDPDEFAELGPEEYFYGDGVCLIEWAERVTEALPPDRWEVEIEVTGETERNFTITAIGESVSTALQKVKMLQSLRA